MTSTATATAVVVRLLPRREPPLVELLPEPRRSRVSQRLTHDENEVGAPCVMVALATPLAVTGLARFVVRAVIRGHDVGQLMKTRMLTYTYRQTVIHPDLHTPENRVRSADAAAAHDRHRVGMGRERRPEPLSLLDGVDIGGALPMADRSVRRGQDRAGRLADRQSRRQLCVVGRLL